MLKARLRYWQRIAQAYLRPTESQLSFWHERPELQPDFSTDQLGLYPMRFAQKADYSGPFDAQGIMMLDYRGQLGLQYNPIAIAQYALAHYNRFKTSSAKSSRDIFLAHCDWLVEALQESPQGTWLLPHNFDFEYFQPLKAPWYSGLAQGSALSALLRAHKESGDSKYERAAQALFQTLRLPISEGGVLFVDAAGDPWIEEYFCHPPTHILNGFIWALWGLYDYAVATGDAQAKQCAAACTRTLEKNLRLYDMGFWSLYELSPQRVKSPASPYYHQLHCVQLEIMYRFTGAEIFKNYAKRWKDQGENKLKRTTAWLAKAAFKVFYY